MASASEGYDVEGGATQEIAAEHAADAVMRESADATASVAPDDATAASPDRMEDIVDLSGDNDATTDAVDQGPCVADIGGDAVHAEAVEGVDVGSEDAPVEIEGSGDLAAVANDADNLAEPNDAAGEEKAEVESREVEANDPSGEAEVALQGADDGPEEQMLDHGEHHHDDEDEETDDEDERHRGDGDRDHGCGQDNQDMNMQHDEDEYDPANPSHNADADEYDSAERPDSADHAHDEYDPANPAEGLDADGEKKTDTGTKGSPVRKRKMSDTPTVASPSASNSSARSPKRPRGTTSHKVDQRGLKSSAWDRLMDFESMGEFRIAQVSRAAFSTIAQLPEFAQCAIVARFTRTPMKDIRDKNELILRLCREYLGENPGVTSLQPVSAFLDDATVDPGLFAYGYAPPMPISGMSSVKVPFRQDKPGSITTPSAPTASPVKLPKRTDSTSPNEPPLDEFGREIKPNSVATVNDQANPSTSAPGSKTIPQVGTAAAPPAAAAGKPSDPRRRRQGGADTASVESSPSSADTRGQIEKSDVYNRLPISVRSRLDGLIAARRLPEAINDNVLSRLNHLPEATAITAIEKFMESDLRQIGNVNGFLVGIINRVQERGSTSSDPRNIVPAARTAHVPGTTFHQQQYPPHQSQQQLSHAPVPPHGYPGPSAPHGATLPMGHAHSFEHPAGNTHFRDHQTQPPMAAAPVGFDAPQMWNQAHAAAPAQYSVQSGPPTGGRFSSHPTIDVAISALPVAIQNHLVSLVNSRILPSLDDLSEKCYEVLGQLSEGLANDVLKRFGTANLVSVRNRSAFLMGVVKKCRQEYGFD